MEDNWYALAIAILLKQPPESSFKILEEGVIKYSQLSFDDTMDMLKFKSEGLTYRQIGEIYGISDSAACKRMSYYKKKKAALQQQERQFKNMLTNQ